MPFSKHLSFFWLVFFLFFFMCVIFKWLRVRCEIMWMFANLVDTSPCSSCLSFAIKEKLCEMNLYGNLMSLFNENQLISGEHGERVRETDHAIISHDNNTIMFTCPCGTAESAFVRSAVWALNVGHTNHTFSYDWMLSCLCRSKVQWVVFYNNQTHLYTSLPTTLCFYVKV